MRQLTDDTDMANDSSTVHDSIQIEVTIVQITVF